VNRFERGFEERKKQGLEEGLLLGAAAVLPRPDDELDLA
jgi:hypothetical protein